VQAATEGRVVTQHFFGGAEPATAQRLSASTKDTSGEPPLYVWCDEERTYVSNPVFDAAPDRPEMSLQPARIWDDKKKIFVHPEVK
jgi:hypothetical protein